jgi:hypothetical protein
MPSETPAAPPATNLANVSTSSEVAAILRERGWLAAESTIESGCAVEAWLVRCAELLGPQAASRGGLGGLLSLIFSYDAVVALRQPSSQDVLARSGARDVIRELANRILEGGDIDSDRFKQIVEEIKAAVPYRSREMFHPIRLALTGRPGDGDLDRIILLLDGAAKLEFARPVKGTRQRILEFCAALD